MGEAQGGTVRVRRVAPAARTPRRGSPRGIAEDRKPPPRLKPTWSGPGRGTLTHGLDGEREPRSQSALTTMIERFIEPCNASSSP